ncbi:MAG TPA: 2-oxoacid:acceptor oxidoreductase family protein, partial [Thermotogota bacterium]|nr:2-oxoacid:acceptor oxidoreductase family protein [Thermotogota bacterium]
MSDTKTVVLVGVGGQGILLVSKVLSELLVQNGYDVKMSEVHGMAQRGGSVSTQIRFGEKVNSPFMGYGGADILLGFEKMETYRFLPYVKSGGTVIYADATIPS